MYEYKKQNITQEDLKVVDRGNCVQEIAKDIDNVVKQLRSQGYSDEQIEQAFAFAGRAMFYGRSPM